MDDWSSFRTTTSEQQRLRAALSGFCESQDLPEEQRAAYTAYLRKRIRSAVETLIREDNFSRLETLLQTGWLSDADRKRFLNLAADQQKWQAFHILLNRNSQDPMQENTESRKTEAAVQKEKSTKEKEALALRLFEEARKNLCWLYPELGEAILFFQHQPSDRTKAITSDGHTIYFNSDFVLRMCTENSSFLKEGYQHLLLECIRRFGKETPEPEKKEQPPVSWLMPEKEKPQTDEIQKQLDKLADKRILVLVSDQRFDKEELLLRYQAVMTLKGDKRFIEENEVLLQELELCAEDIRFEIIWKSIICRRAER